MKKLLPVLAFAFLLLLQSTAFANTPDNADAGDSRTAITEARYNRLMRTYVNKIKLAFVQPEDAQTLEMLKQYSTVFIQQTDALKTELVTSVKDLNEAEIKALYERLAESSRNAEIIALMFDERIAGRMQTNQEIRNLVELLHAKSLEIPNGTPVAAR